MKKCLKATFWLDQDYSFHLEQKSQIALDWILRKSGATMPLLDLYLSRIKKFLLDDYMLKISVKRIHEFKPNRKHRWWIFTSALLTFIFFGLNIIDYYLIQNKILTFIGLAFLIPGLLIQFLFIVRKGKIFKEEKQEGPVYDEIKLQKIESALNEILPEVNRKLKPYQLRFDVVNGSFLELKSEGEENFK